MGKGFFKEIGDFFSGGDGETGVPQRQAIGLDRDTVSLMDQAGERSLRSTDQIADEQIKGTEGFGADVNNSIGEQNRFSGGLAMQEPADLDVALQKRGDASFKKSLGDLRRQAKLKAGDMKIGQGASAGQYKAAQRNIAAKALGIERQNIAAKKEAMYALVGAIIGTAATVTGAAMGMPPTPKPGASPQAGGGGGSAAGAYGGQVVG